MAQVVTKAPITPPAKATPKKPAAAKGAAIRKKPERARGGEARRIADLVPAVGDTAFRKFGFVQSSVITRWPEIVGPRLARVTAPESLRFPMGKKADGTLSITVSGAHGPIVQHIIPDIIERVNRFFGYAAIARVRMTAGQVKRSSAPPTTAQVPGTGQPADALTPAILPISPGLGAIADPELRAVLEGLASSLAKRDALPKIS
jgi:hypothetical protein